VTLYRGLEAASSDVSFGKAHKEEVGHDSFAMGSEVCGEVNVDDIQVTGNVDDIAAYGLGRGLGSAEGSGYVPSQANN
jgi:hypothetical protein